MIGMRLAFIITAHKLPDLLIRLVNRLQLCNAAFFIHVDKKSSLEIQARMKCGLRDVPGVYFVRQHKCYWGDFGPIQAALEGMRELIVQASPFDYAILLTGQDYPIKPNSVIQSVLARAGSNSFMSYVPLPSENWDVMDRIERWHHWFRGKHIGFPLNHQTGAFRSIKRLINSGLPAKRQFPPGLRPFGGCAYWCLTREAVLYVAHYVSRNPEVARFFKRTVIPDELFFQTILMNSPLGKKVINEDLRYVDWEKGGNGHPAILRREDYGMLRSTEKLFARKFDPSVDSSILDMIDRHLLGNESSPALESAKR
jgi:hypothetical protein